MSKAEQAALVAWVNSFRPSKRVTAFEQLSDGRALAEVLTSIDGNHFKGPARGSGAGPSSDNWVLKTNSLKRMYRQLLSYPLPTPHHPLSTSSLTEPSWSAIVKSPTSADGTSNLIQLARMVLCLAVWAPGNEKVISKIQALGEVHMAELMKGIEEVMATMPPEDEVEDDGDEDVNVGTSERGTIPAPVPARGSQGGAAGVGMSRRPTSMSLSSSVMGSAEERRRSLGSSRRSSPEKRSIARVPSPPLGLRAERDKLAGDNDELLGQVDKLSEQVKDLTSELNDARNDRDDALHRLATARDTQSTALRSSQTASSEADALRADLHRSEENVARLEDELSVKSSRLADVTRELEDTRREMGDVNRLRDQLDEYKHAADQLRKNENVLEKYKKKLDEAASVRREMRNLEAENAQLLQTNTTLQDDLREATMSLGSLGDHSKAIAELESQISRHVAEIAELQEQLNASQSHVEQLEDAHAQKLAGEDGDESGADSAEEDEADTTLGEELSGGTETKTQLRNRLKVLETRLADLTVSHGREREEARRAARQTELQASLVDSSQEGGGADGDMDRRMVEMKEKDRIHLEEIKRLLQEKVELQSAAIEQREKLLAREKEFGDLREALARDGTSSETHKQLADLVGRNLMLQQQVERLQAEGADTSRAGTISDAEPSAEECAAFELAQKSYEAQITSLRAQLSAEQTERHQLAARYAKESQLMLSAWSDLGNRQAREHVGNAVAAAQVLAQRKRGERRAMPGGWLGRQRRWVEDGMFSR